MAKMPKRYAALRAKVDSNKLYALDDALVLIKECAVAKFDESIDVAVSLGVDTRKSDQVVRGSVVLPAGTGKIKRVAVFAQGAKAEEAKAAGADIVGFEDWPSRSRPATSISTLSSPRPTRCAWSVRWVRFSARAA